MYTYIKVYLCRLYIELCKFVNKFIRDEIFNFLFIDNIKSSLHN